MIKKINVPRVIQAILVFLFVWISFASAQTNETINNQTYWYVDITEGLGASSGDKSNNLSTPQPSPSPSPSPSPTQIEAYTGQINENVGFGTGISALITTEEVKINEKISASNGLNTSDTSTPPINWTPIILWGMVILFLAGLGFGIWYVYQIYFY